MFILVRKSRGERRFVNGCGRARDGPDEESQTVRKRRRPDNQDTYTAASPFGATGYLVNYTIEGLVRIGDQRVG